MHCYFWITVCFPGVVKCIAISVSVALIVHKFCNYPRRTFFALHNSNLPEAAAKAERIVRMNECVLRIIGEAPAHRTLIGRTLTPRPPSVISRGSIFPPLHLITRKNVERVFKKLLHFFTFLKLRKSEIV